MCGKRRVAEFHCRLQRPLDDECWGAETKERREEKKREGREKRAYKLTDGGNHNQRNGEYIKLTREGQKTRTKKRQQEKRQPV